MIKLSLWVIFFLSILVKMSFAEEIMKRISVPDKEIIERLARLEAKVEALDKRIDDVNKRIDDVYVSLSKRIDDVNKRIDDLQNLMLWGFGILFMMIISLFGYIVWDRRTALIPVVKKTEELKESNALIIKALKEYSKTEPRLAEILKSFGIL